MTMYFISRDYFLKVSSLLSSKIKRKIRKNPVRGFVNVLKQSAGRGYGTEGVLSYT